MRYLAVLIIICLAAWASAGRISKFVANYDQFVYLSEYVPDNPAEMQYREESGCLKYIMKDAELLVMNTPEAFSFIVDNWCKEGGTGMGEWGVFSAHADPNKLEWFKKPLVVDSPPPDPNAINKIKGYRLDGSDVIHLYLDCRYILNKLNVQEISLIPYMLEHPDCRICVICERKEE